MSFSSQDEGGVTSQPVFNWSSCPEGTKVIYIHNTLREAHPFITYLRSPRASPALADLLHPSLSQGFDWAAQTSLLRSSLTLVRLVNQTVHYLLNTHIIAIRSHKSACGDHRTAALVDDDVIVMSSCGPHYLTEVICLYMVTNCIICTLFALFIDNTILDWFIYMSWWYIQSWWTLGNMPPL